MNSWATKDSTGKKGADYTHIGNPQVIVSVQIVPCDAMKALRELDIRKLVTCLWVQEKAHRLTKCFTIVGAHVAIKSENKGSISH